MDLKINKGKDYLIGQLRKEWESFAEERQGYVEKLMSFSREAQELKATVLQLSASAPTQTKRLDMPASETTQTRHTS